MSSDDAPTRTSNRPGSTTHFPSALTMERSSGLSVNRTVCVCPGQSEMRRNPLRDLIGRCVLPCTS